MTAGSTRAATRRPGLTALLAVALSTLTIVTSEPGTLRTAGAQETPPNILIVVTDDQRAGMSMMPKTVKFFGGGGTTYTRGFTNTPLCCPARATLMSGTYPHNHNVVSNHSWSKLDPSNTLQADLQSNGYRTAIFGKYLNNFPVSQLNPPGFDRWAIFHTGGKQGGYYRDAIWNENGVVSTNPTYTTRVIRRRAVRFVRENSERPWLMYVTVPAPHGPFDAERAYEDLRVGKWTGNPAVFERDRSDKPTWVQRFTRTIDFGRRIRRRQYRTLPSADELVGALATSLEETGQDQHTLAFFTTDNGYLWGEHGMGGKPSPYMPSIKVPFYVRWPEAIAASATDDRLVGHVDITATAYDAAGVEPNHAIDGRSLLTDFSRDRLLTEMLSSAKGIPRWTSLITAGGDHYIEYFNDEGVLYQELYGHARDPWELSNIAPYDPGRVAQLTALLALDKDCSGAGCP